MEKTANKEIDTSVTGFRTIKFIGELVIAVLMKFWALCTTTLLILILAYWFYGGIAVFLLLVAAVLGLAWHSQDYLLYYPEQPPTSRIYVESPAKAGLPHENIYVHTEDGVKINMYLILQQAHVRASAPTLIYFHGNAGNIGHRLLNSHALYSYVGCNVLLVEYRGYGKSGGTPSEQGVYYDAKAALNFVTSRPDLNQGKIVIFGRSLGGAVAIYLASCGALVDNVMCLIIENTFTSLPHIARHLFDFWALGLIPKWAYKNKYPSISRMPAVKMPTLFLSGMADQLIPPRMMQQCYEQASSCVLKRLARFEHGTHNETWQCPGYYETINRFFAEINRMKDFQASDPAVRYNMDVPFDDKGIHSL